MWITYCYSHICDHLSFIQAESRHTTRHASSNFTYSRVSGVQNFHFFRAHVHVRGASEEKTNCERFRQLLPIRLKQAANMGEELHCGLIGLVAGGQNEAGEILPRRLRAIRSEINNYPPAKPEVLGT
jgi:hypothetical protein